MINILIADDNREIRLRVRQLLSELYEDISIIEASTGNEALEILSNNTFNCILLDINMPYRSGVEILKQLSIKIPVIILSTQPAFPYSYYIHQLGGIYIEKSDLFEMLPNTLSLLGIRSKPEISTF